MTASFPIFCTSSPSQDKPEKVNYSPQTDDLRLLVNQPQFPHTAHLKPCLVSILKLSQTLRASESLPNANDGG